MAEEQDQQLSQIRADMAERLVLNRQRLEEEHASFLEAQAQVCNSLHPSVSVLSEADIPTSAYKL